MKVRLFAISILLNAVLLGGLALVVAANRPPASPSLAPSVTVEPVAAAGPGLPATPAPAPFQWSKLEATDDAGFVANLRGIGCPDQTIHDLIAAKIGRIYDQKIHDLEAADGWLEPKAIAAWRSRQDEEIAAAMGWPVPPRAQTAEAAAQAPPAAENPPLPPPKMPLALVDPHPDLLMTDQQTALLQDLRQEFIDEVGGPNQDPASPEYRERWAKAEAEANQRFKVLFGHQASLMQHLQANQPPGEE